MRRFLVGTVVAATAAACVPAADAGTLRCRSADNSLMMFIAAPGEKNAVEVRTGPRGSLRIRDRRAPLIVRGGRQLGRHEAACDGGGDEDLVVRLGDSDDTARVIRGREPRAFVWLEGAEGRDTLTGARGPEIFLGGAGDDTIKGDEGDDRLFGESGNDTMDGGADYDVAEWQGDEFLTVRLGGAIGFPGERDALRNVETYAGWGTGVRARGTNGADSFDLSGDRVVIDARGGDDFVAVQDQGTYTVDLGDGDDEALFDGTGTLTLKCGRGRDTVEGIPKRRLPRDCEVAGTVGRGGGPIP